MSIPTSRNFFLLTALLIALSAACQDSSERTSERLVFNVQAEEGRTLFTSYSAAERKYTLDADEEAFLSPALSESQSDSSFTPLNLTITISLLGDLVSSLRDNPNGYHVQTQLTLEGGTLFIDHTNQASLIVSPEGDSLYAIHGEGIVSYGTDFFKNISGLFFEESTYKISALPEGTNTPGGQVRKISCRYELIVDF